MFFLSFIIGLILLSTPLASGLEDNDGFNANRNRKELHKRRPPRREITPPSSEEVEYEEDLLVDQNTSEDDTPLEIDTTPHAPLADICIQMKEYCEVLMRSAEGSPAITRQKQAISVLCDTLQLLANLADEECNTIRLNTYMSNISRLVEALQGASASDDVIKEHETEFPLATALNKQIKDKATETFIVYYSLRTPATALPLITALFNELSRYVQYKLHDTLMTFKEDTKQLLSLTQTPEAAAKRSSSLSDVEKRTMKTFAWLCRHAAHSCQDLAAAVPSSPLLSHTSTVINQVQHLMDTMTLTYSKLSSGSIRSMDRHLLAQHYAFMVAELHPVPKRRGGKSILQQINTLANTEDKQFLLENIFSDDEESESFLEEFFPAFGEALDQNVDTLSKTLCTQMTNTLTKRYWHCDGTQEQ